MSRFIAKIAIYTGLFFASLGNYWYTFGLWPRSWTSFFGFFFIACLLYAFSMAIDAEHT